MIDRSVNTVVLLLTLTISPSAAQDKDKPKRLPGDEMIEKYLAAETDKLSKKFLDGAKTLDEWKEKLPRLKREYMDMLGLWPIPEKTPLKATITGEVEAHGVVVEKLHFQSKPGLYVTANLYRPKDEGRAKRKQLPAIVYVCGHSGRGRDGNKTAFQDHGFWFANNGYVCIVLDTLQLGELPGVHHGTYGRTWGHLKAWGLDVPSPPHPVTPSPLLPVGADSSPMRPWWWSAGYTPAGVECWNGIRAIDYLLTRPDVDSDRIGVTGISGGGAATFWIAAADERVKVAVPVSGMSDLESYVKNKVVNGHCDCMFLYNTYQWDWTTIAALVAPRPMLFANSDNDGIFPMDGNRRIYKKLQQIYGMYGADKAVGEYVSVGGHDYRPDLRKAIFRFFNLHLTTTPTALIEDSAKYTPLPGKDLRVFPTDADIPKDAINARIDETFVPRAKVALPAEGKFAEWKKRKMVELKDGPLRSLAQSTNVEIRTVPHGSVVFMADIGEEKAYIVVPTLPLVDSKKLTVIANTIKISSDDDLKLLPQTWNKHDHVIRWKKLLDWNRDHTLHLFQYGWQANSPPNFVERSHVLLGQTIDANSALELAAFVSALTKKWPDLGKSNVRLAGEGQAGILAAYAALFEPSIKEVVVIDPPKSHKEGPHFLGILRVLDIPEALGLLAPTPLTIIGGKDAAFDRTAEIYRLAGAADKLKRK